MPSMTIGNAPLAGLANLTDRIPVSQGDGEAKSISVQQILANVPPYDLFSELTETVVAVTAAATAQFGTLHICSGTTADYTVSLPAAAGNAGKLIGFSMAPALTKKVSVTAFPGELIDGIATRIMWAGETAMLLSDGVGWIKIAGKSIPMVANLGSPASATWLSVGNTTFTKLGLNTIVDDPAGLTNTSTFRITIARPGRYKIEARAYFYDASARVIPRALCAVYKNGVNTLQSEESGPAGCWPHPISIGVLPLTTGDYLDVWAYHNVGAAIYVAGGNPTFLSILEVPAW